MEQKFKELNTKTENVSQTATTALNKILLAEVEIKKFANSSPEWSHSNATDIFSIPSDHDDSNDELCISIPELSYI